VSCEIACVGVSSDNVFEQDSREGSSQNNDKVHSSECHIRTHCADGDQKACGQSKKEHEYCFHCSRDFHVGEDPHQYRGPVRRWRRGTRIRQKNDQEKDVQEKQLHKRAEDRAKQEKPPKNLSGRQVRTKLFHITNSPLDAASALAGSSIVGSLAAAAKYIRSHAKMRQRSTPPRTKEPEPKPESPITATFLFSILNKVIPRNAVIAEECPSSKGDLDRFLELDEPGSFYSVPNGILGFGAPAAVGLQLAHPDRRVVCPVGDGSIQYSIQALWTAVQTNAAVIFIVIRNSDYSALKAFCDFTQVGRNAPGMDLPGIDMVKLAEGYGMTACEVDRPEHLEPALREAFAAQAPRLISVNVAKGGQTCMGMDQSVNPPNYR